MAVSFTEFLTEEVTTENTDIQVAVLTKVNSKKPELVSNMIQRACDKRDIPCYVINTNEAWISKNDLEKGTLTISNIDGEDTEVEFDIYKTVCFVRAGALANEAGLALVGTFESAGAFMINNRDGMMTCDNKMSSYIAFERNHISVPKTALVTNEKSLEHAHKAIGGKFPVIVKTITGTQGIGVSIVNDWQSMVSVIQSLWKFGAELLIQEYLEFKYDVRTIVLNGKILASTKRIRPKNDFRSNRHRGATTEPHELSELERHTVLAAARSVGAYIVGVDHAIVGNDIYVLECNGSAGIGSNFSLYDVTRKESDDNDYVGDTTPEKIVDKMIEYISITDHLRHSFPTESGYVERIEIDGYGPIRAKFDTGNGTKASMFVVDKLEVVGKKVFWEKDGKKFENKLQGTSHPAHVGKIDERPIVYLDVRFNNKLYKDVPFGLSTKDSMSTVLVNRDLLTRFKVSVNPNRRFVLSDWIKRHDSTDIE